MSEHKEPIPSMIYNASVGGHVTNSQQIIDENENKEQSQINTENKNSINTIITNINTINTSIGSDDVPNSIKGRIKNNENDINLYKNKKIILIQDSYGTNNGSGTTISTTTPIELNRILSSFGISLYSKAQNGAGFCNGEFLQNLQTVTVPETEKQNITDIWVLGGWNDEIGRDNQTEASLKTAMGNFLTYTHNNYPNAKVHLAFISYGLAYQSTLAPSYTGFGGLKETLDIYRNSVEQGFYYEGRLETVLHNMEYMVNDWCHPNANGAKYVAERLADLILTGDTHIHHKVVTDITGSTISAFEVTGIDTNITVARIRVSFVEEVNDDIYTIECRIKDTSSDYGDSLLFSTTEDYPNPVILGNSDFAVASIIPRCMRIPNIFALRTDIVGIILYTKDNVQESYVGPFQMLWHPNDGTNKSCHLIVRTPFISNYADGWRRFNVTLNTVQINSFKIQCNAMEL